MREHFEKQDESGEAAGRVPLRLWVVALCLFVLALMLALL